MGNDVTQHRLVPKHELLGEEEAKKFLEENDFSLANLPEINIKDPAIARLKAKEGSLIRITRQSYTAGTSTFYRKVVA